MAGIRASSNDVKAIITTSNSDENDNFINLNAYIKTASLLVDKIESKDSDGDMTDDDLREVEKYLAAHFYTHRDRQYESLKNDVTSEKYQGKTDMYFESSLYGQTAKLLDTTGYLAGLEREAKEGGKRTISVNWLGKPKSQQIDYVDRD